MFNTKCNYISSFDVNNMDVEASIAERLQKLRQWQVEQQERLLKQQQMQREILSHEQDRIYKVLGLSMHGSDIIENTKNGYYPNLGDTCVTHETEMDVQETMSDKVSMLQCAEENLECASTMIDKRISMGASPSYKNCDKEQSDDSNCTSTSIDKSGIFMKDYSFDLLSQKKELSDSLIEGVKPLSSNDVSNKCVSIDDILLSSTKKDFQTLLEEKLKKESEITLNTDTKIKPKKPFLKKGQGLLRFKMSTNPCPTATTKRHNIPSNISRTNRSDKSKKSVVHKHVSSKSQDNISVTNEKQQMNLKAVPLSKKIFSKSTTPTNRTCNVISDQSKCPSEMNMSDCDSKAEKELEEVRIFELLEEKAENSSFCSTSSTVLAFLQQSTPFKVKDRLNQMKGRNSIMPKKQQTVEQTSDIEQESKVAHHQNLKSSVQYQVESFEPRKHSHAAIDSFYTIGNTPKEIQNHFIPTNRVLRKNEAYTNHSENHDTSVDTVLSDSDEERDISVGDNLMHDSETDASHHVRFSEYNEYRTIDSSDMSDTMNSSLKDYLEQQNWNDRCSVDTLELSDVKKKLPHNYEEQILDSLKIVSDERAIDTTRQLPLQQDVTGRKDSYTHIMETICVSKEEKNPVSYYKNELPDKEKYYDNECIPTIEKIIQTSDEERSVLSSSLSSSSLSDTLEVDACEKKEYVLKNESKKLAEEITKVYSNVGKIEEHYSSEERTNQTFETELLKSRLLELEKEINIFRKESSALRLQRQKLQENETILHKQYAEKEKNFEETKKRVQNQLEEEKKIVAREKIAMENRIRDAQEKARQSKLERQKVQNLQEQLEQLRDELNIKESRWNAAESRYKSELRVLRVEISKLKQEIANLQNTKKINVRNLKKSTGQVITKAINQINKRVVVAPSKEVSTKICQDLLDISDNEDENENKNESIKEAINVNDDFDYIADDAVINKVKYKQVDVDMQAKCNQKFLEENVEKKRHLYENLLKDATSDLMKNQNPSYMKRDISSDSQPSVTQIQNSNTKSSEKQSHFSPTNKDFGRTMSCVANNMEYYTNRCEENQDLHENNIRIEKEKEKHRILPPEKKSSSTLQPSSLHSSNSKTSIDAVKQIQFSDGRIEYWYSNGNVKKIFPDQEVIKMIYYNGDVRETDKNGKVKYFYAATRTWHTTMSDGLEILEFPDGQVEKRMSDGTVEVLFPDGTVAQTFSNGDKILSLPNGQREIHTKAHKRREYPDGTVKLVYADGTQETRYSSGRKRLKDKDGNLLMDSYDV